MKLSDMDADTVLQEIPDDETPGTKSYWQHRRSFHHVPGESIPAAFWKLNSSILKPKNGRATVSTARKTSVT